MTRVPPDPPVIPYLVVHDGAAALDWYVRALGAEVPTRYDAADGRLSHAMLAVNGGAVYLADEFTDLPDRAGCRAPRTLGGTSVMIALAVDDVDAWVGRAVAEGAVVLRAPVDDFYGRHGKLRDPFGHIWSMIGPKTGL